jgi:Barstar (barnase inhibitor)
MLIRIDAGRLTSAAGLHAAMDEAFGFAPGYGRNLDALADCLTHLDDPKAGLTRVQVFPGQVVLLVIDHTQGVDKTTGAQVRALADVVAFVNWRRLEKKQPPVLALAYEHG